MVATYPIVSPPVGTTGEKAWAIAAEIAAERLHQIQDGKSAALDDVYIDRELARAAGAYALVAAGLQSGEIYYPWGLVRFTYGDPRKDLIRSAALAMAEIERLDRAQAVAAGAVAP